MLWLVKAVINLCLSYFKGRCFLALDWDSKVKDKYYDEKLAEVTIFWLV